MQQEIARVELELLKVSNRHSTRTPPTLHPHSVNDASIAMPR